MAVLKKMAEDGTIPHDETAVCYITGNGLKATDSIMSVLSKPKTQPPDTAKIAAVIK